MTDTLASVRSIRGILVLLLSLNAMAVYEPGSQLVNLDGLVPESCGLGYALEL